MGKIIINNALGADIEIESKCGICGETHRYRLKERRICSKNACYEESKKRQQRESSSEHPSHS